MGTCDHDANGEATSGNPTRARVRMRDGRDGTARSSDEVPDKGMERRGCVKEPDSMSQPVDGMSPMKKAKPLLLLNRNSSRFIRSPVGLNIIQRKSGHRN